MIVLDVINQFLQQVSAIIYLEQRGILLIGVDACYLLMAVAEATTALILGVKHHIRRRVTILACSVALRWIEHITRRRLNLLIEFEHFDDVSFLAVALTS